MASHCRRKARSPTPTARRDIRRSRSRHRLGTPPGGQCRVRRKQRTCTARRRHDRRGGRQRADRRRRQRYFRIQSHHRFAARRRPIRHDHRFHAQLGSHRSVGNFWGWPISRGRSMRPILSTPTASVGSWTTRTMKRSLYVNTSATANHVDMEIHLTGTNINLTGSDILHHA